MKRFLSRLRGVGGRHILVLLLSGAAFYLFFELRAEWSPMHKWNRALGDVSVLLIAFSMAAGPLARIWPTWKKVLPWRREAGIYGTLSALAHTGVILGGWLEWDLILLFGYQIHPTTGQYVMLQQGFALANIVGIVALGYGAILALTSNNKSQNALGQSVWKFIQRGAYVLWALIVLHTAYFLYLHFQDFHRAVPEPNVLQWPFAGLVLVVLGLQTIALILTWWSKKRRLGNGAKLAEASSAVAST